MRILKEGLIEMLAGNARFIAHEADDLVTVLRGLLVVGTPRNILFMLTSGLIDRV